MNRSHSFEALILDVKNSGENNRSVISLSKENGIFFSTLYGGPKSKLRSLVCEFNCGKIWVYKNESKNLTKITDFEVQKYHLSFRENLFKAAAASLTSEIVIKTKCAGSPKKTWDLLNGFFDGMELSSEKQSKIALLRFLWRYLDVLGLRAESSICQKCKTNLINGEIYENFLKNSTKNIAFFDFSENAFLCFDCAKNFFDLKTNSRFFPLSKESVLYLEAVSKLDAKSVRKIFISEKSYFELKNLCFSIFENILEQKPKTLCACSQIF